MDRAFPTIKTHFDSDEEFVKQALKKYLPREFFSAGSTEQQKELFISLLPIVGFKSDLKGVHSLYALHCQRINAFKFFFDYINRWLLPGKQINISCIRSIDFSVPEWGEKTFALSKIYIKADSEAEIQLIQNNLEKLLAEIKSGLKSNHSAKRIIETKSFTQDEKTLLVHENIIHLIQKFPQTFNLDFLNEMQHGMAIYRNEFKMQRSARHLTRIISFHYLFRKWIYEAMTAMSGKRHLCLKISPLVTDKNEPKKILSLFIGLNFLTEKEIFQKNHLLACIQHHISGISCIEHSFIYNHRDQGEICSYYLEIQKNNGKSFSNSEISLLRQGLPHDLKDRVQLPLHQIFMPRNDEEIMRNILALGHQIKFLKDIPQVAVTFDEQTSDHLYFTVILVRVLKPEDKPFQDYFKNEIKLRYIPDRSKNLGFIRKKYPKEAQVFRLKIAKESFIRKDHTIDLFKARQFIIDQLNKLVGEVRDFNGGMIAQQNELLKALKEALGNKIQYNELLLENFFYSLLPIGARAITAPHYLKGLFSLLIEALEKSFVSEKRYDVVSDHDEHNVYIVVKEADNLFKEKSHHLFDKLDLTSKIIQSQVIEHGVSYLGYIYPCQDLSQKQRFLKMLFSSLQEAYAEFQSKGRTSEIFEV